MNRPIATHSGSARGQDAAAPVPVRIDQIDTLDGFDRLRPFWDQLHAGDPDSGVFLSHGWLRALFAENPGDWVVFALRHPGDPARLVAGLPLRRQLRWSRSQQRFLTTYAAAGRLCFTEYTGFVCDPARESWALAALGRHVAAQPWARFALRYEPTNRRLRTFSAAFSAPEFAVSWPDHRINRGETDQLVCPQIPLPGDFDSYLEGRSRNTRKKIRKTMRRYFGAGEVVAKTQEDVAFEPLREGLLDHWAARWEAENSPARLELVRGKYRRMIDRAQALGLLYMPSLWQGDRMIGALGFVVDPEAGAYHCMVTGRDTGVGDIDVGLLMHAHAISDVIRRGGRLYDFGHGTEPYKFHYASTTLQLGNLEVLRRNDDILDPAQMPQALIRCQKMLARGRTRDLNAALTQLAKAGGRAANP
ncbi:GNAT family N-acetyltransferase [Puniceibacterium confluentis]|uniref:GNAT family N-acetyltransferase n=1 Tax=Puniceibacterium confluentis TaxID=1958944 RepID=UPI00164507B4|nr:GNAT family N-acetyltransferase [Puniceibacterium confluentis]